MLLALELEDHRNITAARMEPSPGLNVICGNNGQGKTNLLEAVWLLTGGKSFRGAKDAELVRRGEEFSVLEALIESREQQRRLRFTVGVPGSERPGRCVRINGVDRGRASAAAGEFTAVVFAPEHLSLVKGSPAGRRRFLDAALCQLYPGYLGILRRYTRLLAQKNALLKHWQTTPGREQLLEVYDEQLAVCGAEGSGRRAGYLAALAPIAAKNYEEISHGSETLMIQYQPCPDPATGRAWPLSGLAGNQERYGAEKLRAVIGAMRGAELRAGCCLAGPHREDILVELSGQDARAYASQGQQRSAVLSLKLAEAAMAAQVTGEHPVLLLDDVLSELDATRQEYLLTRMEGIQSFVTACDPAAFLHTDGVVYTMQAGELALR